MEAFRKKTIGKYESVDDISAIDQLISEFPEELRDRLWDDVEDFDDSSARDYLVSKLIDRKMALLPSEYREIPETMEVINNNPEAVQESLERAHQAGSDFFLGAGHNAEVVSSTRQDGVCYKTLFMERAQNLGSNIAREALLQNAIYELMSGSQHANQIPRVEGFVKTAEVQAIKMEKIHGFSLRQYFDNPEQHPLPEGFDVDSFFESLTELITCLNNAGYFHRDLVGNAGNILCGANGLPVLIDFGSAVKAIDFDPDSSAYQIVPGGQYYIGNDLSAVQDLKNRFVQFELDRSET